MMKKILQSLLILAVLFSTSVQGACSRRKKAAVSDDTVSAQVKAKRTKKSKTVRKNKAQ